MSTRRGLMAGLLLAAMAPTAAVAQGHEGHSQHAAHAGREIKALSAEQVQEYLSGDGMGLALAAELNGHPGPRHVLELDGALELTDKQRAAVLAVFDAMRGEAQELGRRYVEAERELDRAFAERVLDEVALSLATAELGRLLGEIRNAHLRAHLRTTALLTTEQIRRYDEARGYAAGHPHP